MPQYCLLVEGVGASVLPIGGRGVCLSTALLVGMGASVLPIGGRGRCLKLLPCW